MGDASVQIGMLVAAVGLRQQPPEVFPRNGTPEQREEFTARMIDLMTPDERKQVGELWDAVDKQELH